MNRIITVTTMLVCVLFLAACAGNDNINSTVSQSRTDSVQTSPQMTQQTENAKDSKINEQVEAEKQPDKEERQNTEPVSSISGTNLDKAADNNDSDGNISDVDRIVIRTPDGNIVIALENNSATADLLNMLPMTLHFEEFNNTEKISYIDGALNTESAVTQYSPKAGSFAYYIPWGNLSVFYEDFRESVGLAFLGTVESGMEYVNNMDSYESVTIEALK